MNPILQKARKLLVSKKKPTEKAPAAIVPAAKPGGEERGSHRLPVSPDHQPCELRVKENILAAALINESKTGFAVLTDRLDGLEVGEAVEVHTDRDWIAAEIVYIEKVAACASSVTGCNTLFQLGVKKTHGSSPA